MEIKMGQLWFVTCKICITILHGWIIFERFLIRSLLFNPIKSRVRDFFRLDKENRDLVVVNNNEFYIHVANKSMLGFCESYIKGWITIRNVDVMISNILRATNFKVDPVFKYKNLLDVLEFEVFETRSNIAHFDQGNELFKAMLGPSMTYSCALWLNPTDTLESAQIHKMQRIAEQLHLIPGMRVLDVGCGWGSMAHYLAKEVGVSVVATTTSKEGAAYTSNICERDNLDVAVHLGILNDLTNCQKFDAAIVVEVLSFIRRSDYRDFFQNLHVRLKSGGLLFLQVLGTDDPEMPRVSNFHNTFSPDARIPFVVDLVKGIGSLFRIEEWKNIGTNYDKTSLAWNHNFQKVRERFVTERGESWCRMWEFVLQFNAAMARTRNVQVWQIVLSKCEMGG